MALVSPVGERAGGDETGFGEKRGARWGESSGRELRVERESKSEEGKEV